MVLALTELIRQETKAQGGKITSPGLAQQVAEACLMAEPLHCSLGEREENSVLTRQRGLTYALLFLSGEGLPTPGSFP